MATKYIKKFYGEYDFLSNFYVHEIFYNGLFYASSEHAYQAAKTTNKKDHDYIVSAPSPGSSKKRAQKIKIREDWEDVKYVIMKKILYIKFENTELKAKLLATDPIILIEGNNWHDNTWGNCECMQCRNIEGKNWLGKILMDIRKDKLNIKALF